MSRWARSEASAAQTTPRISSFSPSFISRIMDFSPSPPSIPRLRITRHSQLSPLDDDLSRTPTTGPSRLHVLQHEESEDTDATPRLTVSSSLRPRMQLDIYWY